jgi:hypothetical protein
MTRLLTLAEYALLMLWLAVLAVLALYGVTP